MTRTSLSPSLARTLHYKWRTNVRARLGLSFANLFGHNFQLQLLCVSQNRERTH
jgi:hypothetical protein